MGHYPISEVNIMNAPLVINVIELPVWFVNITSCINVLLNTTSENHFVVTYE